MEQLRFFENEYMKLWIGQGIVYCIHHNSPIITLEIAQKAVSARISLSNGKTYPLLVDIRGVRFIEKKARNYLAEGESLLNVNAGAIIIDSVYEKSIAHFFLKVDLPPLPAKVFFNFEKAVDWLEEFKVV